MNKKKQKELIILAVVISAVAVGAIACGGAFYPAEIKWIIERELPVREIYLGNPCWYPVEVHW